MANRPLVVVLLRVPVSLISFAVQCAEAFLATAFLCFVSLLYFLLKSLTVRYSVTAMLLSAVIRIGVLAGAVWAVVWSMYYTLFAMVPAHIALWVSLSTETLICMTVATLTVRGMKHMDVKDCRPYVEQTLIDLFAVILTIVTLTQASAASVIAWPRLLQIPNDVDRYPANVLTALGLAIIDALCIALVAPLIVFPWRLIRNFGDVTAEEPTGRIPVLIRLIVMTAADIAVIVPLMLVWVTVYRVPRLQVEIRAEGYHKAVLIQAGQVAIDLPFFAMGAVAILGVCRAPAVLFHVFSACDVPKSSAKFRSVLRYLQNGNRMQQSGRYVAFVSCMETIVMPVLLAEWVVLAVTVYRFPHSHTNVLFHPQPFEACVSLSSSLFELLIDIPFLFLLLAILPLWWRSLPLLTRKRSLSRSTVLTEFVSGLFDLLSAVGSLLIIASLVRVAYFRRCYDRANGNSGAMSRLHLAVAETVTELCFDLLHAPLLPIALAAPWRLPALYRDIRNCSDPSRQRLILRNTAENGLAEIVHGVMFAAAISVSPWQCTSLRCYFRVYRGNFCEVARMMAVFAVLDWAYLVPVMVSCVSIVNSKKAVVLFLTPARGDSAASIEEFTRNRRSALCYYATTGAFVILSVCLQSLMCATLWRIPSMISVCVHFADVLPEFTASLGLNKGKKVNRSQNPLLIRNKGVEYFVGGSIVLFKEWAKDVPFLGLALLTPPWRLFLWIREVWKCPFLLSKQQSHRKALLWSSRTGCLDVLSLFATVFLVVSLWRLPFFYRLLRRNAQLGYTKATKTKEYLSYHFCVLITFREWVKDLPFIPLSLILSVIAPWRIPGIFSILTGQSERIPTIKQYKSIASTRLQLLRMLISVTFFDYPTLLMTVVLLGTVWRAVPTLNILKLHISKLFVNMQEDIDSTVFREITVQMFQLIIDLLELLMAVTVLILCVRARDLVRRIRRYTTLYSERKGFSSLKVIRSWVNRSAKPAQPAKFGLASMSKNLLFEICSFLELPDIGRLQSSSLYLRSALIHRPIWHFQYTHNYSQYIEQPTFTKLVTAEFDYKQLAVNGLLAYRSSQQYDMSEEDRDYRLGLRAVLLEEFVLSFLSIPQILMLPAKGLALAINWFPYQWYAESRTLLVRRHFKCSLFGDTIMTYRKMAKKVHSKYHREFHSDFRSVHLNLCVQLSLLTLCVLEHATWAITSLDFFALKVLSGWRFCPLNRPLGGLRVAPPTALLLFQLAQVGWLAVVTAVKAGFGLAPFLLCWKTTDYSLLGCVFGPACLNTAVYALLNSNLSTLYRYRDYFPFYAPVSNLLHVASTGMTSLCRATSEILSAIASALTALFSLTSRSLSALFLLVLKVSVYRQKIRWSSGNVLKKYAYVLFKAGKLLRPYGLMGDVIFTPFTLVWMLWPMSVPYILGETYYYIPAGVVSAILTIRGYHTAQAAWS